MGLKSFFANLTGKMQTNKQLAKFLNSIPVFSQFGESIYASDVVQNCIDAIATEISKMQPQHIRVDTDGVQSRPKSSVNRLFRNSPNPVMTTSDFLEKIIWLLFLNYNTFVYPKFEVYDDNGQRRKRFTGMYPLNPTHVDFLEDPTGTLFVRFRFKMGQQFTLPYDGLIHIRKKYSINDIMGGGENGQPDNDALLKLLQTNDILIQGMPKAIKTSLAVRGIIKINTVLSGSDQEEERKRLEALLESGDSSLLPMDLKSEYQDINSDIKIIDAETLKLLENKISRWFGVSPAILSGDFNDDQYQAFYEKTLEPILIKLGQAFTKVIFSDREQDVGNKIVFYAKDAQYLTIQAKLNIIKIAGEQGLLTNDQKLRLLGYPPLGGIEGAKRTQSLNYVDVELVNDYQMTRASAPQINAGGANNE